MRPEGLTDAQVRQIHSVLIQECKLELWNGREDDVDSWLDLGEGSYLPCRMTPVSRASRGADASSINADSEVIVALPRALSTVERNGRYRLTVVTPMPDREVEDSDTPDTPQTKETLVLESTSCEMIRDLSLRDIAALFRCSNGKV